MMRYQVRVSGKGKFACILDNYVFLQQLIHKLHLALQCLNFYLFLYLKVLLPKVIL